MKKTYSLFLFLVISASSHAQGGIWTWVKGDSIRTSKGNIGIMNISNISNYPEARFQASQWTDLDGNFWIFGGADSNGRVHNDMWKYEPYTNMWTWVKGSMSPNGQSVYGLKGVPDSNNIPSSRAYGARTWTDLSGRLWLAGGAWGAPGTFDDVWRYDIPTNQWTWIKGSITPNATPVYGTLQVSDSANTPGRRYECNTAWVKSDGTLWTFGGCYFDMFGNFYSYNDMWKFDVNTNNWTWMSGPQDTNRLQNYGTLNVEAPSNLPPSRATYSHWQDADDNFYIFGGARSNSTGYINAVYNDVWKYNTSNNQWTWVGGDSVILSMGLYINPCTANNNIRPTCRFENRTVQIDACSNTLWTFGGSRYTAPHVSAEMNDLWVLNPSSQHWKWVSGDSTIDSHGNYGRIGVPSINNSPPARGEECLWIDRSGTIWMWGGGIAGTYNDMWKFVPDTNCVPINTTAIAPIIIQTGDTLKSSHATRYQWQLNGLDIWGDTTSSIIITQNGTYSLIATNALGCETSSSVVVTSVGIASINDLSNINLYPNPASQTCTLLISNYQEENYVASLIDITGRQVSDLMSFAATSYTFPVSQYAKGIYLLQVSDDKDRKVVKKLVIE